MDLNLAQTSLLRYTINNASDKARKEIIRKILNDNTILFSLTEKDIINIIKKYFQHKDNMYGSSRLQLDTVSLIYCSECRTIYDEDHEEQGDIICDMCGNFECATCNHVYEPREDDDGILYTDLCNMCQQAI